MSDIFLVDCVNCGHQTEVDFNRPGDTCLFCGKEARKKEVVMSEKAAVVEAVEAVQDYNRGQVPAKPSKRSKLDAYWRKYAAEIMADYNSMQLRKFLKRWHMATTTWTGLKKLWEVPKKARVLGVRSGKVAKLPKPAKDVALSLSEHDRYLILQGYQQATREFLKILGKKLENRHE